MSRFEAELIAQLAEGVPETTRAIVVLQLAAYKARKGEIERARELILDIRRSFAANLDPQVFAHINFAESICDFFDGGLTPAFQKLKRSKVLAAGCPSNDDLPLQISAWMASYFRILRQWGEFEKEIGSILRSQLVLSPLVDCRASLVIADSYQDVEDYSRAHVWYSRARAAALKSGDDSMFGVALYNPSAIRIYNLRIRSISDDHSDLLSCRIELQTASAQNYSQYIKDNGMAGAFELLEGQLALLGGKFNLALEWLTAASVHELVRDWPAVGMLVQADTLYAKSKTGAMVGVDIRREVDLIRASLTKSDNYGDIAIAAHALHGALADFDESLSSELLNQSISALAKFELDRKREREVVASLDVVGS